MIKYEGKINLSLLEKFIIITDTPIDFEINEIDFNPIESDANTLLKNKKIKLASTTTFNANFLLPVCPLSVSETL